MHNVHIRKLNKQKKCVTKIRYPYFIWFFKSFTSFFMLTTSVFTLSMFLSIFPIRSFISIKLAVISLFAEIDSFINGTIYLYIKKPINRHIVIGNPTLSIRLITSFISIIHPTHHNNLWNYITIFINDFWYNLVLSPILNILSILVFIYNSSKHIATWAIVE